MNTNEIIVIAKRFTQANESARSLRSALINFKTNADYFLTNDEKVAVDNMIILVTMTERNTGEVDINNYIKTNTNG